MDALLNVRPSEGRCGIRVQRRFLTSKHVYLLSSRWETYLRHDCDLSVSPSLTRSLTPALFVLLECLSGIPAQWEEIQTLQRNNKQLFDLFDSPLSAPPTVSVYQREASVGNKERQCLFPPSVPLSSPVPSHDLSPAIGPISLIPPGFLNQNWQTTRATWRSATPGRPLIKIVCLNLPFPSLPLTSQHVKAVKTTGGWMSLRWLRERGRSNTEHLGRGGRRNHQTDNNEINVWQVNPTKLSHSFGNSPLRQGHRDCSASKKEAEIVGSIPDLGSHRGRVIKPQQLTSLPLFVAWKTSWKRSKRHSTA